MATEAAENIYRREGFEDRADYLRNLAEEYGVDENDVLMMADLLGPNEDFDGLVIMVQDMSL